MGAYLVECAAFLLRWLHVVAAIAWIGESFYFVALDRGLEKPRQATPGLFGESWSVHGGGFYLKQKFLPAPPQLPEVLHWSKWKSYTTWLSGFGLLCLTYLLSPQVYLIDVARTALSPTQAVLAALAFPLLAWLAYDGLCRLVGFRDALLGALVALLSLGLAFAATQLFAGRAAFLLVGASLATIMSANVFFVIIPGQKRMVAALGRGEAPNPLDGARGKQRSVHNTYFTLPVVFAMLSNHYATAYAHAQAWLVLAAIMAAGALIRQFFVLWHSGERAWWLLGAGGAVLAAVFVGLAPPAPASRRAAADTPGAVVPPEPDTAAIQAILARRCTACHSAHPSLMASAPKGAQFDSAADIDARAELIHRQVVQLQVMPPGNLTQMTAAERDAIARWYEARSSRAP
ncbi:MAG: urate hydroxylase PuuD [Lysobacterales bacterium]